jgi:hypothetical protein
VRKQLEIGIGRDYIQIEQIPAPLWLLEQVLHAFCSLTKCRFCGTGPVFVLENYALNRSSRTRFELPVADEPKRALAEWLGITTRDTEWTDDAQTSEENAT